MIKKLSKNDIWPHIRNIAEKPHFFLKTRFNYPKHLKHYKKHSKKLLREAHKTLSKERFQKHYQKNHSNYY